MAEKTKVPQIRLKYNPKGEELEVLQMVYKRKQAMEDGSDYKEASKNWDKWLKQWESWRDSQNLEDWQSNHVVPLTFSVVESALSEIVDQTPRPLILARGREDVPKATVMKHIFDYTWEVSDGDTALFDVAQSALILGTAIGQEYYYKQPKTIRNLKLVKNGDKTKEEYTEEEVFEYDDCYLEPVRLQDFRVDENARGFDGPYGARDCMRRYIMDIDDFKNFFTGDVWDPLGNSKLVQPGGDTEYYEYYKPSTGVDHTRQVEVWWYWSRMPKDYLVIIANDVVVRMGPNIYRHKRLPFARAVDVKRPFRFYGKGEPEILESTQDEKNVIRRMIIDRNHLDIDKSFLMGNRNTLSEEDTISRPHALIPVDDVTQFKPVEYGDVPRSTEFSLKSLDEDGIMSTGIDPRLTSMPQTSTATQSAIVKETMLKRIRMKIRILEREFLTNVARLRVSNIIQFYSQPTLEKIVGEAGTQEYQRQIQSLESQGLLVNMDGQDYKKKYKDISIKGKELGFDAKGGLQESAINGYSFFEAKPEHFVPSAKGGFMVKFAAGSTLPISKPLMQTKAAEMFDRLIQLAAGGIGYDPVKLGDMLLKVNDEDPEDYHLQQSQDQTQGDQSLQMQISLAMDENKMLLSGKEVPPTPFASPAHTRIHIQYMQSSKVPSDKNILQLYANHVVGELAAQAHRGGETPSPDMMGGEAMPGGQANSQQTAIQGGESARQAITPGKATKPAPIKMGEVLPNLITGSRTMPVQA